MKNVFFTVFVFIILILLPKFAFASCAVKPSIADATKEANVIFVGSVTKIMRAQVASAYFPINGKKVKWEKSFWNVDVVTFTVSEAFKGLNAETIEVATGADGFAGYKFEGGTWLKEGQSYLVYAYEREPAGTMSKDAGVLIDAYKQFPKKLAEEINEFNKQVSPYESNVCGRTTHTSHATKEIEQVRKIFPDAKRFDNKGAAQQIIVREAETATFLSRLLSFFGLA